MAKTAFLGLGVMGYPMAGHLVKAGHQVRVWNRTGSVTQKWDAEYTGTGYDVPSEAVKNTDIVMMCVGQDADVLAVAQKAIPSMREGSILVDHTTASDGCAREVAGMCEACLLYTSPSPRDQRGSRMPSSA